MYTRLLLIFLIALPLAIEQVIGAVGCGNRQECSPDKHCPTNWTCLGPSGSSHCYNCKCNKTSQCYLEGNSWACNCSDTDGDYGTDCKCPPEETPASCTDVYSIFGQCIEFSNSLDLQRNNIKLNTQLFSDEDIIFDGYLNSSSECLDKCLQNKCHLVTYGANDCAVFAQNSTASFKHIFDSIIENEEYTLYINTCNKC